MSKSLNLFLPAIGGTALVLGGAYGFMSRDYAAQQIESLEIQVEQSTSSAADAVANVRAAEAEIEQLAAERDELQVIAAAGGGLTQPAPVAEAVYGLGRQALPEEVAAWDVDVLPDGRGLPVGSGDVWTGEELFVDQCAACHGDFAEGSGNWPVLAGGFGTLSDEDPVKTIGSYWPYLSTSWDYINRSMPFGAAGTLSADDTYAIVAYILYSNDLIDDDFVLSNETFMDVELPNAGGFVLDDRADTEYTIWRTEPCMTDCKDSVEITMHASVVDVTPETEEEAATEASMTDHTAEDAGTEGDAAGSEAAIDPALIEAGQSAFRQCSSCHEVGENASNRTGPELNGLLGRSIGSIEGFRYSNVMSDAGEAGDTWTVEALDAFLTDPRGVMSGTKMAFRGVRDPEDIAAIVAYIQSVGAE